MRTLAIGIATAVGLALLVSPTAAGDQKKRRQECFHNHCGASWSDRPCQCSQYVANVGIVLPFRQTLVPVHVMAFFALVVPTLPSASRLATYSRRSTAIYRTSVTPLVK
jgi:hypothetical protein